MINLLVNIIYHISSWVIIFLVLSWIVASFYPLMSRMLAKATPEYAAFFILLYGLIAPAAAFVVIVLLSLPEFAFPLVADHCHGLDCDPHRLQVGLNTMQSVTIVAVLVSLLIIVSTLITLQLVSSRSRFQTLNRLAEPTSSASYKIIDSNTSLACCSGLINPKIFVSRGLAETLSAEEMQVILAHEQAHVSRKDNLRKWVIHWATIAWPKRYKKRIKQNLFDYTEQACDLMAAKCNVETTGIKTVMDTIKKCHSTIDINENTEKANGYKRRIQMLKKAWELRKIGNSTSYWVPTVFMSSLWLLAVISTVHIGHPILEWIAT